MIIRAIGIFHKKGRKVAGGTVSGWLLVTAVASSLIFVGSLVWINNSTAVIPGNDPTTFVQLELIDGIEGNEGVELEIQAAGHDNANPIKSQLIVRGNGNQDDNKEEAFCLRRYAGQVVKPEHKKLSGTFSDRYTAVAYRDFGHLKVMPASETFYILAEWILFKVSRIIM